MLGAEVRAGVRGGEVGGGAEPVCSCGRDSGFVLPRAFLAAVRKWAEVQIAVRGVAVKKH